MAKYLFILGMYYPRSSANGVCCKNIIDALVQQGDDVTCLVNGDLTRAKNEIIDGAHVIRIKPRLHYRFLEWCYYHNNSKYSNLIRRMANLINKVQLFVMSPLWPRISPGYTRRFYKAGKKLLRQEKFDSVVSVYTPIDTLYAGYKLKKRFPHIRFIPYYLDALAGGWGPSIWSINKINARTRKLEEKIDSVADVVISMLSSKSYHTTYPLPNSNLIQRFYLDVPTFVAAKQEEVFSEVHGNKLIRCLYSGSIHFPDRDPRPLLEHFVPICNKFDVELLFMGSNNCQYIFDEYSQKTKNKIRTIGQYSHSAALKQLKTADVLINIGSTNPNTVTCKIFEYMQLMKPIISTYSIDNEPSIPYLNKYGCFFLLNEKSDIDFEHHNKDLINFILNPPPVGNDDYTQIFYLNTPQSFIDILKKS